MKTTNTGLRARLLSLIFCSALVVGCARPPIRIGVNDWPPCAVWTVAERQGFLKDCPIQLVRSTNWSDNMTSLYLGNLDLVHSTYLNAIFYAGKGEGAKIIASIDTIEGSDGLVISTKLRSPMELVGKRIAVEVDTDEHFLLFKALASFGISQKEVKIVSTTSKEAGELFKAGKVDACFTYDPYLSEAAASGTGRIAWTTKDAPGYMVDVMIARDSTLSSRRADVKKVMRAWYRALDYIKAHPEASYPPMAEHLSMKMADFAPFYEAFTFYSAEDSRRIFASDSFRAILGEMNAFLLEQKAIPAKTPVPALYSSSVVKALGR